MKRSLRGRGSFGRLLLCALLAAATSAPVSADQYGYDELGNVETLSNPRGVRSYTYDEIQRLDTETGYSGNRDHAYDLNGNRTTDGASAPGTPTTATYTSNTNRIATLNGAAVTLDAAGQITNDGLNSYTWDDAGRLKTVSRGGQLRATYYYDHKHRRTRKVTTAAAPQGAKTLVYHYDDQDRLIAETTETGAPVRSYLWADTTLLAQVEYTLNATTGLYTVSRELLFELDHLGTPRQARLTGGSAVWRWESDGYGNTLPDEDPDGNGQKTYVYLRFPGQYFDEESGLHYNWHRYYVPRLGRYLSSDPIGVEGGDNIFAYANQNPISKIDPFGLTAIDFDPSTGTLRIDPEMDGQSPYTMPASSGRPNCGCDASAKDKGPIPSGSYTLHTDQLSNPGRIGDILRNMRGDWGDWRVPLTPDAGTNTFGRSGFFLHGGFYPGSAGCIDVGGGVLGNRQTEKLLRDILSDPDGRVPVIVK
jgi:RHS repeat-associated protein